MKMDLFIRTYHHDAPWLYWLMRSIPKFCSGYNEIVVACPQSDVPVISRTISGYPVSLKPTDNDRGRGYLEQQYTKMCADQFCSGDYIGFVDSDCIFIRPNSPASWFHGDKIRYLITPYTALPPDVPWQRFTEKALGFACPYETMRRHPCVFPREVIEHCRSYISVLHKKPLRDYILEQGGNSFSEFNAMGSYAFAVEPEKFVFIDTTQNPLPPLLLKQAWSYGGITNQIVQEYERILAS